MKAFLGCKKKLKDKKAVYGLTIYSNEGKVLHSSVFYADLEDLRFLNNIKALDWAVKKIKALTQQKVLSDTEKIYLVIDSKTLYAWFEKEVAPEPYTVVFGNLYLDISFILNPVEIIYSPDISRYVLYKESEETMNVLDFLRQRG